MGLVGRGTPQQLPLWLLVVKIAIILLSIIVLGLSAWALSLFLEVSDYSLSLRKRYSVSSLVDDAYEADKAGDKAPALMIFVCLMTAAFSGSMIAVERMAPNGVMRLPVFITYIVVGIFSLSAWAYMASYATSLEDIAKLLTEEVGSDNSIVQTYSASAAATAFGAIIWVLLVVDGAIWIMCCLREPAQFDNHVMSSVSVQPTKMEAPGMTYAPQGHGYPPQPSSQPYAA